MAKKQLLGARAGTALVCVVGVGALILAEVSTAGSAAAQERLPWGAIEPPTVITPGAASPSAGQGTYARRSNLGGDTAVRPDPEATDLPRAGVPAPYPAEPGPPPGPWQDPGGSVAQGYGNGPEPERPYNPNDRGPAAGPAPGYQNYGGGADQRPYDAPNRAQSDPGRAGPPIGSGRYGGNDYRAGDNRAADDRPYDDRGRVPSERPYDPGPSAGQGPGPGYGRPYEREPGSRYDEPNGPPGRPPVYSDNRDPDRTYSPGEISEAGGRFFGKISSGLASVIEYAFQRGGRPTGYILGDEGGGAFIAGLRYGEGTLHLKDGRKSKVFWQGPSLGYDFGAEGSKTMILVYNIYDPGEIFQTFGGVDGSAYFVGGVGITFQKNDRITLAPIRSGVGLRIGANVGYLKYTPEPTWNPF